MSVRPEELDAVTIDGHGTLLELCGPLERLEALVPGRSHEELERALAAEAQHYRSHSHEARDAPTLAQLRADCAAVLVAELGAELAQEQVDGVYEFAVLPGVVRALRSLRARGLALAVVANWDFGLHEHLERHGLRRWFDTVVVSAELGARKPDPLPFRAALERLGVRPERALHVGDHPAHDEVGARAAGMHFAHAPLAEVVAWT